MGTLFWATVLSWRKSHHWNLNYDNSMQNLSQIFIILLVSQSVSHDTSTLYRHTFPTWTSRLWSLGPWRTVPRTSRQQGIWEIKINRLFNFFPTTSLKFQGPFSRGSVATNSFLTPTPAPENRICFFCTFQYLLRQLLIKNLPEIEPSSPTARLLRRSSMCLCWVLRPSWFQKTVLRKCISIHQTTKKPILLTTLHSSLISSFPRQESGRYDPLYGLPATVTP